MEVATYAITLGVVGAALAGIALGMLIGRWVHEREIRALRNANRAEREEHKRKVDSIRKTFEAYRDASTDALVEKDRENKRLKAENATLRVEVKCAELRIDIHQKLPKKA